MEHETKRLYSFLKSVKGEWRNAVYIECDHCPYSRKLCGGILMTADVGGNPMLYASDQFRKLTGECIDGNECAGRLTRTGFESLYNAWLKWNIGNGKECCILQLLEESK